LRAYQRSRYHALYAPGRPRHRPNRRDYAKIYREQYAPGRPKHARQVELHRQFNQRPEAKARAQAYSQRAGVKERVRQRYHERMDTEEGYAMRRRTYLRERRKTDPEFAKREDARIVVTIMLRHGWIHRGPCAVCGATERVEGHHPSYDKPLDVVWLCRTHHRSIHFPHLQEVAGGPS
jgi:hypothetical protein